MLLQVRQECELLAGLFSIVGEADKERKQKSGNLELECRKLQKKVCFYFDFVAGDNVWQPNFGLLSFPINFNFRNNLP